MAYANPFSLAGRRALVAGASRGIGQAIAEALAHAGAHTILASRNLAALGAIADALRAEGLSAEPLELDIASAESRRQAADAAGEVDILVNVAGTNVRRNFTDYTRDEYQRLMETNLTGIFELTQQVGGRMLARGAGGKVIMIGSLTSIRGLPYVTVYSMTKSALAGLTRTLAAEWGPHNIQVNCIAPGFIVTDLNRDMWNTEQMQSWVKMAQPNPRLGTPADVAPLAVFLASPGADYISGQTITVDGALSESVNWPFRPA